MLAITSTMPGAPTPPAGWRTSDACRRTHARPFVEEANFNQSRPISSAFTTTLFREVQDRAFGHQMASDLSKVVKTSGGIVVGEGDFSSFLLRAQSSKAQIIGLASAGADTINSVKQAGEYRIAAGGQKLAGLVVVISDIDALGLTTANGLMPGMVQAGTYSAVLTRYWRNSMASSPPHSSTYAGTGTLCFTW